MRKREHLGQLELMILLAVLRGQGHAYGASIAREIEDKSGRPIALAGIYSALARLEERGFVTSHVGEPTAERGGKARVHFTVTRSGIKEVRAAMSTLQKLAHEIKGLDIKGLGAFA